MLSPSTRKRVKCSCRSPAGSCIACRAGACVAPRPMPWNSRRLQRGFGWSARSGKRRKGEVSSRCERLREPAWQSNSAPAAGCPSMR
jgi:hypothetical protein